MGALAVQGLARDRVVRASTVATGRNAAEELAAAVLSFQTNGERSCCKCVVVGAAHRIYNYVTTVGTGMECNLAAAAVSIRSVEPRTACPHASLDRGSCRSLR